MSINPRMDTVVQSGLLSAAMVSVLPSDFSWTETEQQKIDRIAKQLHCSPEVAGRMLVFFLVYISVYKKEIPVAELPNLLAQFPIKWGYKKKRHDFMKLLQDLDFIFVQTDYWAKVRAKKYGIAKSGQILLTRVLKSIF